MYFLSDFRVATQSLYEDYSCELWGLINRLISLITFQSTSDRYSEIAHGSIKNNTDKLHDDTLTPADLITFALQIANGMVRVRRRL